MIWQEMRNIFLKEESTGSLTTRHWEDKFFCTIWNMKWFKFSHGCILNSNRFPTSTHTPKSELKRRSYGPDKLEKKKTSCSPETVASKQAVMTRKLSRDKKTVSRPKKCRDQETWSRPKKTVSRPACCVVTKNAGEN